MKQITNDNFVLVLNTADEEKYMSALFKFIKKIFISEFGNTLVNGEKCVVFNDKMASCPMLITNNEPICLRTCAKSLEYWAQYIYQLSHELTHYVIRQKNHDKDITVKWFEETLCEAMSLYILKVAGKRWNECELFNINPDYSNCIQDYLQDEYKKTPYDGLKKCKTLFDLQEIEDKCQDERQERISERNYLYELFNDPNNIVSIICNYTNYIKDNKLLIDFEKWAIAEPTHAEFINRLSEIQPISN